jgi:glycosyltransferase involved in cell wall biosynthesis
VQPKDPEVTVGVPVYNSDKFLAETLQSILAQTFTNFELIISDNASTDATEGICSEFARRDARVRYVRKASNVGAPRNYNSLVSLARSKFFKWSSSNDLIQPQFLAACVPILRAREDVVLVYTRTRYFDANTGTVVDYADNMSLQEEDLVVRYRECDHRMGARPNNIMNGVIRLDALKNSTLHGDYPSSDLALMTELALYGKFVEVPEPLFYRRNEAGARYGEGTATRHKLYYPDDTFGSMRYDQKRMWQLLRGVARAPVTWSQRVRLYEHLARRAWWSRRGLLPFLYGSSKPPSG